MHGILLWHGVRVRLDERYHRFSYNIVRHHNARRVGSYSYIRARAQLYARRNQLQGYVLDLHVRTHLVCSVLGRAPQAQDRNTNEA